MVGQLHVFLGDANGDSEQQAPRPRRRRFVVDRLPQLL